MKGYVYILESERNRRFYVGSSINPEKRLTELHNRGKVMATRLMIPWRLVFKQEYENIRMARMVEYKLKRMKSKKILEEIVGSGVCFVRVG